MDLKYKLQKRLENYKLSISDEEIFAKNLEIHNVNYFTEFFENENLVLGGNGYLYLEKSFEEVREDIEKNNFTIIEKNYSNTRNNCILINNGKYSNGIYLKKRKDYNAHCYVFEDLFNLEKNTLGCFICAPGGANPIHKYSNLGKILEKYIEEETPLITTRGYKGPIRLEDKNSWEIGTDYDNQIFLIKGIKL
ncbi:hypothetical protein GW931_03550 [archaeon]|nr:hypothetical protein [archaeon]